MHADICSVYRQYTLCVYAKNEKKTVTLFDYSYVNVFLL